MWFRSAVSEFVLGRAFGSLVGGGRIALRSDSSLLGGRTFPLLKRYQIQIRREFTTVQPKCSKNTLEVRILAKNLNHSLAQLFHMGMRVEQTEDLIINSLNCICVNKAVKWRHFPKKLICSGKTAVWIFYLEEAKKSNDFPR